MDEQVRHFASFRRLLTKKIGREATHTIVTKSIHFVSIGGNDFILDDYVDNFDFNERLLTKFIKHIEFLYAQGVRRMVIVGLGALGCIPHYLSMLNHTSSGCDNSINFLIAEFNMALRVTVADPAMKHKRLNVVYCDIFGTILSIVKDPFPYEFQFSRSACCRFGRFGGLLWPPCLSSQMACNDANLFVWWDIFHPTAKLNELVAQNIWSGDICQPMNLRDLVSL